jgi:cell division transport system permease protein
MITILKRIIGESWNSFWRQGGVTFATCFILALALIFIGSLVILKSLTDYAVTSLENKVDISVYFTADALESDILSVKDQVSQLSEVKEVEYVSSEQALENILSKPIRMMKTS